MTHQMLLYCGMHWMAQYEITAWNTLLFDLFFLQGHQRDLGREKCEFNNESNKGIIYENNTITFR